MILSGCAAPASRIRSTLPFRRSGWSQTKKARRCKALLPQDPAGWRGKRPSPGRCCARRESRAARSRREYPHSRTRPRRARKAPLAGRSSRARKDVRRQIPRAAFRRRSARSRSRGQQDARDGAHIHFVIHFRPLFRRDAALCGIQTVEVLCKKRRQIAIVVKMVLPNVYSAQNQDAIFGEY